MTPIRFTRSRKGLDAFGSETMARCLKGGVCAFNAVVGESVGVLGRSATSVASGERGRLRAHRTQSKAPVAMQAATCQTTPRAMESRNGDRGEDVQAGSDAGTRNRYRGRRESATPGDRWAGTWPPRLCSHSTVVCATLSV